MRIKTEKEHQAENNQFKWSFIVIIVILLFALYQRFAYGPNPPEYYEDDGQWCFNTNSVCWIYE